MYQMLQRTITTSK